MKPQGMGIPMKGDVGFSRKVPYTRAGEISFEKNPTPPYTHQGSVSGKARRIGLLTAYDSGNMMAAAVILADPAAHGGLESLACRWAEAWTLQHPKAERMSTYEIAAHASTGASSTELPQMPAPAAEDGAQAGLFDAVEANHV